MVSCDPLVLGAGAVAPPGSPLATANVAVFGSTGGGKTTSIVEAQMLHSARDSLVVSVAKPERVPAYVAAMEARGYAVGVADLSGAGPSTLSVDPFGGDATEEDLPRIAAAITGGAQGAFGTDPFWGNSATCLIEDVALWLMGHGSLSLTALKSAVLRVGVSSQSQWGDEGGCIATGGVPIPTLAGVPFKTASCIASTAKTALRRFVPSEAAGALDGSLPRLTAGLLRGDPFAAFVVLPASSHCADALVYMGSGDVATARELSERVGVPVEEVLRMPRGAEVVCARGEAPLLTERFPTTSMPEYAAIAPQPELL